MAGKVAGALAGLLFFTYFGYPLLVFLLSRFAARPVRKARSGAFVSIILPVHNEGARLGLKLLNLQGQDYARERIEIIVVDDGSNDGAADGLETQFPGICVVRLPERQGKASAHNAGVAASKGEVLVFTDARQDLCPEAISALTANFEDKDVAAATGRLSAAEGSVDGLFRRYEEALRAWEGAVWSCAGATGALYAVRRSSWTGIPSEAILDDFVLSLAAARKGRLVYEGGAVAFEAPEHASRTWTRRLRTLAGNWQILLHPVRFRMIFSAFTAAELLCHKALRLFFPGLAAAFLVSLALADPFMFEIAFTSVCFGALVLVACPEKKARARVAELCASLLVAPVEALVRYVRGRESVLWARPGAEAPAGQ